MNTTPILITDFYKLTHMMQYPESVKSMTAYMVPRFSRLSAMGINEMVVFGITPYVHDFVIRAFEDNFFKKDFSEVAKDVREVLYKGLGYDDELVETTISKLKKLHSKGHLPIRITGLPEGAIVPMNCPFIEVSCDDPDVPWAGQIIEASLSAAIWHPCVSATIARKYRQIAENAYAETCDDSLDPMNAMCDFSMRGQESIESAVASSAAWLTAMNNSSTVAARAYIKEYYNLDDTDKIAGLTSTEHSVMTTHAVLDDMDETHTFEHLFNVYKNASFAAVCDSYDFWNVLTNILPKFKSVIDERGARGKFIGVRHDSADPVTAVCGIPCYDVNEIEFHQVSDVGYELLKNGHRLSGDYIRIINHANGEDIVYGFSKGEGLVDEETYDPDCYVPMGTPRWQDRGMVETMYNIFGGSINSKGYKTLNPGIKAVYGDSITVTRAQQIFDRLKKKGFAASNVSLGVGSFSFQAIEGEDGSLYPFTRDTFSIAMKCTYAKLEDGREMRVFKSPVGFSEKKSLRGLCSVSYDPSSNKVLGFEDGLLEEGRKDGMPVVYYEYRESSGILYYNAYTEFKDIRNRVTKSLDKVGSLPSVDVNMTIRKGEKHFHTIKRSFLNWAKETNTDKFVVGMSGGKDSTVVAMLIANIFGHESVIGVALPDETEALYDADKICKLIGINMHTVNIGDAIYAINRDIKRIGITPTKQALENLPPRIRMTTLFAVGQCLGGKVINTSNLSEDTIGWATQFGDNAGCYAPIQDFTVTEVKELGAYLAKALGLDMREALKYIDIAPSDGLCGKTDEEAFGFTYDELDRFIRKDEGSPEFKNKICNMYEKNKFKTDIVRMPKADSGLPNYVRIMAAKKIENDIHWKP